MPAVKMLIFKSLVRLLLQSVQEKNAKKSVFFQNSACNAIKCVIYYGDVKALYASPSSRGLGHRVFIPATRVRLPLEMPFFFGRLAQLVRALLSHGRGHVFESRTAHQASQRQPKKFGCLFYARASHRRRPERKLAKPK